MLISYEKFKEELENTIYKNAKSKLINNIASNTNRYVGLFRASTPEIKLIQNITQSHEIGFGDFIENIVTKYIGLFYQNIPKSVQYRDKDLLFDQLFLSSDKVFMIEQKIRDDHDSTKKGGQSDNFLLKIEYLKETYPEKTIEAITWFVDDTFRKNKKYYSNKIEENKENNDILMHLFYGNQLFEFLDKMTIWNEITNYLKRWKAEESYTIELNFEKDWKVTKQELLAEVPKKYWNRIAKNKEIQEKFMSILFPTAKYKEILDFHDIEVI